MIRVRTAARVMPAVWLALPLLMLSAWYATLLPSSNGYGVAATGLASLVLIIAAPFAAGCAAWEGARLRRGGLWSWPVVRPRPVIAISTLLPVIAVATASIVISTCVALVNERAWPVEPVILAVETLAIVGAAIFGFALGVRLPFPIAGPAALLVPFALTALMPALEPSWIRHLTSTFRDCCWIEQQLAPSAAAASAAVDLAVIVVCGVILVVDRPGRQLVSASALGLVAVAAAALLVMNLGYAPAIARDPAALECRSMGGVTLCAWPERHAEVDHMTEVVQRVRARWEAAGIPSPTLFSEIDRTIAPAGAVPVRFGSLGDDDSLIASLAAAMLPREPECEGGATGSIATEYIAAWLSAVGGMSRAGLVERYGADMSPLPPPVEVVQALTSKSQEDRRAWMARAVAVSEMCDGWPSDALEP